MQRPIAIDLFAGCGGLTQGLRNAGFNVLAAIEKNSAAARVYKLNHPRTEMLLQDIRTIPGDFILKAAKIKPGQLDLLAGCPPCQGFSSLSTQNGGREWFDERNDLIYEYLRLVVALQPKCILMENVPGLSSDTRFGLLTRTLIDMGYDCWHRELDAYDFGVPQRRRRLLLVGSKLGTVRAPAFSQKKTTVRTAIGGQLIKRAKRDELHNLRSSHSAEVMRRIRSIPKDGGSRSALPPSLELKCHSGNKGFKDVYGRMAWDKPAPTLTCFCVNPSKGRYLHPSEDRAISLREAAVLQGFPLRYRFDVTLGVSALSRMIGEAFPPRLAEAPAKCLMEILANG